MPCGSEPAAPLSLCAGRDLTGIPAHVPGPMLQRQRAADTPAPSAEMQGTQSQATQQQTAQTAPGRGRQPIANPGPDGNRFDAVLDRDQGVLEITMRVAFQFVNVPGPLNEPWTPAKEAQWKRQFVEFVVARWSDVYVLVPDGTCASEAMSSVRVVVNVVPDQTPPHFVVTVDNQDMPAQSGVMREERQGRFHAPDTTRHHLSNEETDQRVIEHEFGHMLGVHHIRCNGNQPECYGLAPGAPRSEREDVMGVGENVSLRDYQVFADVMRQATGCAWKPQEKSNLAAILIGIAAVAGAIGAAIGIAAAAGAFK